MRQSGTPLLDDGDPFGAPPARRELAATPPRPADPLAASPLLRKHAVVTAADHARVAAKEVVYEWEGIACAGNVVALVGHPGGGKTTLLYVMLAARRNRTGKPIPVLGRAMRPAPADKYVVLIQEEVGEILSERKLRRTIEALGLPLETSDGVLVLARKNAVLGSPLFEEVSKLTKAGLVDSIWVDSLARFSGGAGAESNDESDQTKLFDLVQQVIESAPGDRKPTVWFSAHARKGAEGNSTEDLAGSHQRAAQVDVMLFVQLEKDAHRVVGSRSSFVKVREADDEIPEPCTLAIQKGADGRFAASWSTEEGKLGAGPVTKADVLAVFEARPDVGLTETTIRSLVAEARGAAKGSKARADTIKKLLLGLEKDGSISRRSIVPRRGNPFAGWRLGTEGGELEGVPVSPSRERIDLFEER